MKVRKIIIEIINSGLIPFIIGGFILITTTEIFWGLMGLVFTLTGLFLGAQYTAKASIDNGERKTS